MYKLECIFIIYQTLLSKATNSNSYINCWWRLPCKVPTSTSRAVCGSTCRPGEWNQRPTDNSTLTVPLSYNRTDSIWMFLLHVCKLLCAQLKVIGMYCWSVIEVHHLEVKNWYMAWNRDHFSTESEVLQKKWEVFSTNYNGIRKWIVEYFINFFK